MTRVLGVKVLIGTVIKEEIRLPQQGGVNSDVLNMKIRILIADTFCFYRDAPIILRFPSHISVMPIKRQPDVCGHDLILLIKIYNLL